MNFQVYKKKFTLVLVACSNTHIPQARTLEKNIYSTLNMRRRRSRTSSVLFISSIVIVHAFKARHRASVLHWYVQTSEIIVAEKNRIYNLITDKRNGIVSRYTAVHGRFVRNLQCEYVCQVFSLSAIKARYLYMRLCTYIFKNYSL